MPSDGPQDIRATRELVFAGIMIFAIGQTMLLATVLAAGLTGWFGPTQTPSAAEAAESYAPQKGLPPIGPKTGASRPVHLRAPPKPAIW